MIGCIAVEALLPWVAGSTEGLEDVVIESSLAAGSLRHCCERDMFTRAKSWLTNPRIGQVCYCNPSCDIQEVSI